MRALGLSAKPQDPATLEPHEAASASGADRIAATARRMLAIQGQDWRASRWALGVRTPGSTAEDVTAAFGAGQIVRSWPMRGTIHVVAAEDIGWLQGVTNRRVLAGAPRRRATIGLTDTGLDRLVEVSLAALRGGVALDRDGLAATWTEAGLEWQPGWRYHVIWWLCQNGLTTFGPSRENGEPLLVRTDEWITSPRRLSGDTALAELAARYTAARGPVTERDLAWWAGLTLTDTRRGLAAAREAGRLVEARLGDAAGPTLWLDPGALEWLETAAAPATSPAADWLLLPAFDEHLLGYTDRSAQLAGEHSPLVVPGRNGVFLPTVVSQGRVRGTWRRGSRAGSGIEVTPFPGERIAPDALAPAAERWQRFTGADPALPRVVLTEPLVS